MEKLVELLNEYEIEREGKIEGFKKERIPYYEWSNEEFGDATITYLWLEKEDYKGEELIGNSANAVLISKHYGFIKWLVENEKIDFELDSIIHKHKGIDFNTGKGIAVEKLCNKYESLLMLLSISDTPIEDLLLYLK